MKRRGEKEKKKFRYWTSGGSGRVEEEPLTASLATSRWLLLMLSHLVTEGRRQEAGEDRRGSPRGPPAGASLVWSHLGWLGIGPKRSRKDSSSPF